MHTLHDYIKENFKGMLVISDLHGDHASLTNAYDYAKLENLFLISLGDLVDRGPYPFETVRTMHSIVAERKGAFTVGNHDDKFYRYAKKADVRFSADSKRTLEDVGKDREAEFLNMYVTLIDTPVFSSLFYKFGDIVLVHAAAHAAMWENGVVMSKTQKYRYLVGETTGEYHPDGYPVRLYNWVNDIPMGKTVVVGHDRTPVSYDTVIEEPAIKSNKHGGKAVFTDTGCGKGGYLTGTVITHSKNGEFNIDSYVKF